MDRLTVPILKYFLSFRFQSFLACWGFGTSTFTERRLTPCYLMINTCTDLPPTSSKVTWNQTESESIQGWGEVLPLFGKNLAHYRVLHLLRILKQFL